MPFGTRAWLRLSRSAGGLLGEGENILIYYHELVVLYLLQASRPRPAIDENRRLEVGAGPKGMRLKRGKARVNRLAINERRSLEVGAGPKGMRLA